MGHTHPDGRLIGANPLTCSDAEAKANLIDCVFREIDPGLYMIARAIWPTRALMELLEEYLREVDGYRAISDPSYQLAEKDRLGMEP